MQFGMIGRGRMGGSIVRRLMHRGQDLPYEDLPYEDLRYEDLRHAFGGHVEAKAAAA